ncbi:MAG: MFS transporter [Bacillota bacterium]
MPEKIREKGGIHYGWVVLGVGILVVAGSLGFDRFGYSVILPSMQSGLRLTPGETGIAASANMLGYVLTVLFAGILTSRFGARVMVPMSVLWTGLAMVLTSLAGGLISLALLRFITGIGSAGGNISIMGLASSWFSRNRRGMACGFLVGGSGLAIAFTGWMIPRLSAAFPLEGWRIGLAVMGGITFLIGIAAAVIIRDSPAEKGLMPVGDNGDSGAAVQPEDEDPLSLRDIFRSRGVPVLAITYFCFGFSYIIFATFFVGYLTGEKGLSQMDAGSVWSVVGCLSIGSAVIWGTLSDIIGRKRTLSIVLAFQAASYLLPVVTGSLLYVWISAVLFGFTAWSVPGIVTSFCGDLVGPRYAPTTLGLVTVFFGLGQVMAPTCAGYIKELSGSLNGGFIVAAAIAFAGAALCLPGWRRSGKGYPAVLKSSDCVKTTNM